MHTDHPRRRRAWLPALTACVVAAGLAAGCGSSSDDSTDSAAAASSARRRHDQGRHPALAERHDGDQRGHGQGRRAAGDRGDQRRRRRARQEDRAGRRGRRVGLADVRREGAEADLARTRSPRPSAAGPRPAARRCCRSSRATRRCCATRCSTRAWRRRRTSSTRAPRPTSRSSRRSSTSRRRRAPRSLPGRLRLRLPAHGQQGDQGLGQGQRHGDRRRGVHAARPHRVRHDRQQDQGRQARRRVQHAQRRQQRRVLQAAQGAGLTAEKLPVVSVSIAEEEVARHRRRQHRGPARGLELLPDDRRARRTRSSSRPTRRSTAPTA